MAVIHYLDYLNRDYADRAGDGISKHTARGERTFRTSRVGEDAGHLGSAATPPSRALNHD
jgi:hypothetical protein